MVKLRPHTRAIASTITLLKVCVIPIDRNRVFNRCLCDLTVVQNTSRYVQTRNLNSNGWHHQISIMAFKSVGRLKGKDKYRKYGKLKKRACVVSCTEILTTVHYYSH